MHIEWAFVKALSSDTERWSQLRVPSALAVPSGRVRSVDRGVVNCRTRSQTAIPSATVLWFWRFVLRRVDDRLPAT
jgi:hypothetical protein